MVRCSSCGFLSLRDPRTGQVVAAELPARRDCLLPQTIINGIAISHTPSCFVFAADLSGESQPIQAERECDSYMKWHQGFTPKEHKEMMFDLERQQRADIARRNDRIMDLVSAVITTVVGAMLGYFLRG